jgi:hypothetical protein
MGGILGNNLVKEEMVHWAVLGGVGGVAGGVVVIKWTKSQTNDGSSRCRS